MKATSVKPSTGLNKLRNPYSPGIGSEFSRGENSRITLASSANKSPSVDPVQHLVPQHYADISGKSHVQVFRLRLQAECK